MPLLHLGDFFILHKTLWLLTLKIVSSVVRHLSGSGSVGCFVFVLLGLFTCDRVLFSRVCFHCVFICLIFVPSVASPKSACHIHLYLLLVWPVTAAAISLYGPSLYNPSVLLHSPVRCCSLYTLCLFILCACTQPCRFCCHVRLFVSFYNKV